MGRLLWKEGGGDLHEMKNERSKAENNRKRHGHTRYTMPRQGCRIERHRGRQRKLPKRKQMQQLKTSS